MKVSAAVNYGIANGTIQKPTILGYNAEDTEIVNWVGSPEPTAEVLEAAWNASGGSAAITDADNKILRRERYLREADPLFFQVQRGEVEQSVYNAKIAEIRAALPLSTD